MAIGGSILPIFLLDLPANYAWGYLPCAMALTVIVLMSRIERHTDSIEECFQMASLFGIASYWLPTVVFLTIPVWAYLIYQNLFSLRAFWATVTGYGAVAIWAAVAVQMQWIANPWAHFFAPDNAWGWIPTGSVLVAWIASSIARHILRVR